VYTCLGKIKVDKIIFKKLKGSILNFQHLMLDIEDALFSLNDFCIVKNYNK
jgi:hypothetical protein